MTSSQKKKNPNQTLKVLKNNTSLLEGGEGQGANQLFLVTGITLRAQARLGKVATKGRPLLSVTIPFPSVCLSLHTGFYRRHCIFVLSVSTKGRVKAFRPHTCNSFPVYKILLQFQHNTDKYRCLKNMPLILQRSTVSKEHFILQNWSQTALCKCLAQISDPLLAWIYTGTLLVIASARLLQNNLQSLWNMSTA